MTTPANTGVIDGFFYRNYPNVAGNVVHSGDLVYVDQTSFDLKALDSDAHAQYLAGVSEDTFDTSLSSTAYPTAQQLVYRGMNVARQVIRQLIVKNTDTFNPGQAAYYGTDAQTVTSTPGSFPVAFLYNNPDGSYASGITGDGTTKFLFVLNPQL